MLQQWMFACSLVIGLSLPAQVSAQGRETPSPQPLLLAQSSGPTKTATAPSTTRPGQTGVATTPARSGALGKPILTVVLASHKELYDDLDAVFKLANEPKSFKTLKENLLDLFITGIDANRPLGVRGYLVGGEIRQVISLPISKDADLKTFLKNLESLDIKSKPTPGAADLYTLSKLYVGFLKFDRANGYAHMSEVRSDVEKMSATLPANVLRGYDVVFILDNDSTSRKDRVDAMATLRKEVLDPTLKKNAKENEADFQIRKTAAQQQFAELERFFVDGQNITIGWSTSAKDKTSVFETTLTALPDTSLAKSIDVLQSTADAFSGVDKTADAFSGSMNFVLDPLRKGHWEENLKLWRPRAKQKIEESTKLTAEQKKVDADLCDLSFDVLEGVVQMGVFNGFLKVNSNAGGTYTAVGAAKVAESTKVVQLLEKLSTRNSGIQVKLDAESEGDVKIHALTLPEKQKEFSEFFAKEGPSLYVGTSTGAIWIASGEQSLQALKLAIQAAEKGNNDKKDAPAIDVRGRVSPWIELVEKRLGKDEDQVTRLWLIEAGKGGKDTFHLKLDRSDKTAKVRLQLDEGLLHFAGKAMADFVKKTLE